MTGSVAMMPYQVYQLYQAERTKTAAEIRRADERLGELSRALSSVWRHATRPRAVLRALADAVAGTRLARSAAEHEPVRPQQCTQTQGPRRAAYLTAYHRSFAAGTPSASDRPDKRAA
jgi:hypothetical protein